eukprot:TRINITY_DN1752_c0_g1_i1.p2 TRINITY_DN1752_c0_g1~~TRINITY_DN1752_c0_g1_i1.p2  ORF type:complete len:74 (+),score=30.66 TRINITY_DN1752_c0_g1_i1:164-385(+)
MAKKVVQKAMESAKSQLQKLDGTSGKEMKKEILQEKIEKLQDAKARVVRKAKDLKRTINDDAKQVKKEIDEED